MQNSRSDSEKNIHVLWKFEVRYCVKNVHEPDESREQLNILLILKSPSHLFLHFPSTLFQ